MFRSGNRSPTFVILNMFSSLLNFWGLLTLSRESDGLKRSEPAWKGPAPQHRSCIVLAVLPSSTRPQVFLPFSGWECSSTSWWRADAPSRAWKKQLLNLAGTSVNTVYSFVLVSFVNPGTIYSGSGSSYGFLRIPDPGKSSRSEPIILNILENF